MPEQLPRTTPGERQVIPVAQEELKVQRQRGETGRVVVHVVPHEHTQVVDEPIIEEHVEVERVPVNRAISEPPPVRTEGDVTIVPVCEEVVVVERRLVLKEEIRLTRKRTTRPHRQEVTLRGEEVRIERLRNSPEKSPPQA